MTDKDVIAHYIDHTLLKATATREDIELVCREAKEHNFASVCVNPYYVPQVKKALKGSCVKVCTVIGFPLGANTVETKTFEAIKAVADGADEVDMVMNISAFKSGEYDEVERDIRHLVNAIPEEICVKVILETCYLSIDEIKNASDLAMRAGANFVKTSTGFGTGGATEEAVIAMKDVVGDKLEVKASGGVRDVETAELMIKSGATRIGTSSGVIMVRSKDGKEESGDTVSSDSY